jgi:hypothetical protein
MPLKAVYRLLTLQAVYRLLTLQAAYRLLALSPYQAPEPDRLPAGGSIKHDGLSRSTRQANSKPLKAAYITGCLHYRQFTGCLHCRLLIGSPRAPYARRERERKRGRGRGRGRERGGGEKSPWKHKAFAWPGIPATPTPRSILDKHVPGLYPAVDPIRLLAGCLQATHSQFTVSLQAVYRLPWTRYGALPGRLYRTGPGPCRPP